jgi:hypothetical protein
MRFTNDGKLIRTDAWREGKYLDLWSVPHFLTGMVVAFALYFFGFETVSAFVIAFLLLVGYEMFEALVKIEETRWNRALDVVIGMLSFTPTFLMVPHLSALHALYLFIAVTLVDGILSFLGWRASQKAAEFEKMFRVELQRERERFSARRSAITTRWHERRGRWRL